MRQGRVDHTAGAGVAAGILVWPRKLARPELSVESLAWFGVLIGVILRVWEYLEFRPLYMDEDSLLVNLVGARCSISITSCSRTRWLRRDSWLSSD